MKSTDLEHTVGRESRSVSPSRTAEKGIERPSAQSLLVD